VTLTLMLYFSGGADNPFSFFYFVNLAVGGVMIRPRPAWSMTAFAIVGYMILLGFNVPVEGITIRQPDSGFNLHTGGLLFAFATCATVVTYYVTRTAGELQNRERELRRAQAAQAASHRLEGLTTLAAGAAHELATPLSTIDVIVRELSRHLEACEKPPSVDADLKLIDGQLEMCRQILARMRSAAGDAMADRWDQTTVGDLIDATLEGIRDPHRVDVNDGSDRVENQALWVPQEAVAQAIRNLIHNGLDASGSEGRVRVAASLVDQQLQLLVHDCGQGMTDTVLKRAGDPFFTTKEPGRGIGLGLFLTRNVISQLGGELTFDTSPEQGTRAIVRLPLGQDGIRPPSQSLAAAEPIHPASETAEMPP
ncbi:MAG: sensor histidine kinase, partial [Novipirellula sp. JB048]